MFEKPQRRGVDAVVAVNARDDLATRGARAGEGELAVGLAHARRRRTRGAAAALCMSTSRTNGSRSMTREPAREVEAGRRDGTTPGAAPCRPARRGRSATQPPQRLPATTTPVLAALVGQRARPRQRRTRRAGGAPAPGCRGPRRRTPAGRRPARRGPPRKALEDQPPRVRAVGVPVQEHGFGGPSLELQRPGRWPASSSPYSTSGCIRHHFYLRRRLPAPAGRPGRRRGGGRGRAADAQASRDGPGEKR